MLFHFKRQEDFFVCFDCRTGLSLSQPKPQGSLFHTNERRSRRGTNAVPPPAHSKAAYGLICDCAVMRRKRFGASGAQDGSEPRIGSLLAIGTEHSRFFHLFSLAAATVSAHHRLFRLVPLYVPYYIAAPWKSLSDEDVRLLSAHRCARDWKKN